MGPPRRLTTRQLSSLGASVGKSGGPAVRCAAAAGAAAGGVHIRPALRSAPSGPAVKRRGSLRSRAAGDECAPDARSCSTPPDRAQPAATETTRTGTGPLAHHPSAAEPAGPAASPSFLEHRLPALLTHQISTSSPRIEHPKHSTRPARRAPGPQIVIVLEVRPSAWGLIPACCTHREGPFQSEPQPPQGGACSDRLPGGSSARRRGPRLKGERSESRRDRSAAEALDRGAPGARGRRLAKPARVRAQRGRDSRRSRD